MKQDETTLRLAGIEKGLEVAARSLDEYDNPNATPRTQNDVARNIRYKIFDELTRVSLEMRANGRRRVSPDLGMFTSAGNLDLRAALQSAVDTSRTLSHLQYNLPRFLLDFKNTYGEQHGEYGDTAVREVIYGSLETAMNIKIPYEYDFNDEIFHLEEAKKGAEIT